MCGFVGFLSRDGERAEEPIYRFVKPYVILFYCGFRSLTAQGKLEIVGKV